jgi:hypothetical protein
MKKRIFAVLMITLFAGMQLKAGPTDWHVSTPVTYVDLAQGLDGFRFRTDGVAPPCSGGNGWYLFDARFETSSSTPQADRREIIKRAWAGVLAVQLSGRNMSIYGDATPDSSGNCVVAYIGPN